ncbi:hypothetical protein [Bacillus phage vB_BanS-Thrax5]|nr:hypothetical protein [Bacillus phage vB_BanS-Thrax5]
MKNVFYGKRMMKTYFFDRWELKYTLNMMSPSYFIPSERWEKVIEVLERMKNEENFDYEDKYIYKREDFTRHNEILDVPETSYIPNIGESITVSGRDATVIDKKYNADTDTMHIYTDITLKTDESRYKSTKVACATEMIEIINAYIPRIKDYERFTNLKNVADEEQENTWLGKIIKCFKG